MQANIEITRVADDDEKWSADVDSASLQDFFEDPRAWVKYHTKADLPETLTYRPEIIRENDGVAGRISGIVHVEKDRNSGKKTSILLDVLYNKATAPPASTGVIRGNYPSMVWTTPQPSIWDTVDVAFSSLYPMDISLVYTRGVPDLGSVEIHMEMAVSPADVGILQYAILHNSPQFGRWLNRQTIAERAEKIPGSTVNAPLTRGSALDKEVFSVIQDLTPTVVSLNCEDGQTFTACDSNTGVFSGNPVDDNDVTIIVNGVLLKKYCQ